MSTDNTRGNDLAGTFGLTADTGTAAQFPLTTTYTTDPAPFQWDMPMTGRSPPPDTKVWEAEWAKFRQEFIRKLLANNPKGILNFKQQREKKGNRIYVKVEIEYSPDIDKGARR